MTLVSIADRRMYAVRFITPRRMISGETLEIAPEQLSIDCHMRD